MNSDGEFEAGDIVYIIPMSEVEDVEEGPTYTTGMNNEFSHTEPYPIMSIGTYIGIENQNGTYRVFLSKWLRLASSSPSRIMGKSPIKAPDLCPQCHADETYDPDTVMKAIHDSCRGKG